MNSFEAVAPTDSQAPSYERILAPDLARGMMLLFIAVANVSAYMWGRPTAGVSSHPSGEGLLDTLLAATAILFVDGHVYPMFAFLFGYGISQFAYSRIDSGVPAVTVGGMLLRRHLWLLVFGAVHALLLFSGDVLGAYALTGLVLASALLRGSDRLIRTLIWVLAGVSGVSLLLFAAVMLALGMLLPPDLLALEGEPMAGSNIGDVMAGISNYWLAMLVRFGIWMFSSIGAVLTLLVPLAVLLGGYAARHRWLEGMTTRLRPGAAAFWGITIGVVCAAPAALDHLQLWQGSPLGSVGWLTIAQLGGFFGGIGYAALFAFIGLRRAALQNSAVLAIAAVGKRSLSFYLLQSVVFAPLLCAWGIGLGESITTSGAYLLALAVWLLSVLGAVLLERAGRRGPAEALLRRLSYAGA